jgi:hypothetical protein
MMQFLRQQTLGIGPAVPVVRRLFSTNASPAPSLWRNVHCSARRAANWSRAFLRAGGYAAWRFVALLALLSFLTAWVGTQAVMAVFEDTWTEIALTAARQENRELRDRQDTLGAQSEAALARLEAPEATAASHARTP